MSARMKHVDWIKVYSKWNSVCQQKNYTFVYGDENVRFQGWVQMVYPYVSPAHYTMWIAKVNPAITRAIDPPSIIAGNDQLNGLSSVSQVYYFMFATQQGVGQPLTATQLEDIFHAVVSVIMKARLLPNNFRCQDDLFSALSCASCRAPALQDPSSAC